MREPVVSRGAERGGVQPFMVLNKVMRLKMTWKPVGLWPRA